MEESTGVVPQFPANFRWGVATSAVQIEGSADIDGKGASIWDRFAQIQGRIEDGSDAKVACDHYARWQEDLDLMTELGVQTYRFSVAWPRVLPLGTGAVNQAGLDFYSKLTDGLLQRGIAPFVTLYHWDLPEALQQRGGWPERETALAFAEYARLMVQTLGDRVTTWVTHNEPWCAAMLGHQSGAHAPGIKDASAALAAAHHILLSHGWAVERMRAQRSGLKIGIAQLLCPAYPASPSEADQTAALRFDGEFNRWFMEPVAFARYPEDMVEHYRSTGALHDDHPALVDPSDLEVMAVPTDFLGLNYYSRGIIRANIPEEQNLPREIEEPPDHERTTMGWEVYPDGLYDLVMRAVQEWKVKEIIVTECGAAFPDQPGPDGEIQDEDRIQYLHGYFSALKRSIDAGAPVRGLCVWSLLDNFEWAFGYKQRFGLVRVNFDTQERQIKASGRWYQSVIKQHGLSALNERNPS